eukprot:364598-Alexandrium_andersonii.AAC.1
MQLASASPKCFATQGSDKMCTSRVLDRVATRNHNNARLGYHQQSQPDAPQLTNRTEPSKLAQPLPL